MENRSAMDGKTITAVVIGATVGIVSALVTYFVHREQQQKLNRQMSSLKKDFEGMKSEISSLKKEGEAKAERKKPRKRHVNGYDSDSTMFTAVTSDNDDFHSLSSDEDGLYIPSGEVDETQAFFNKVDGMMKSNESALDVLLTRAQDMHSNPDFLWRLAKAYKLEHDANDGDKTKQLSLINIGLEHARKAVNLDPENGDAHKWLAILLGLRSDHLALKEKLENGLVFHNHLNLALQLKPTDHSLFYLLARFKFAIASLSWFEKSAARMIGEVPEVTLEDAINDAERCEELSPDPLPDNRLLLAKAYIANRDTHSGKQWLLKAQEVAPPNGPVFKEVAELLNQYN